MQKIYRCALALAVMTVTALPAAAGELKLTMQGGLVTVVADDVPVSRILAEWSRIGQTKIVNGEKLMSVVSLELVNVPEKQALDIVLRSASGYLAAERAVPVAGASAFDRIMILPFSQPPAQSFTPVTQSVPQPFLNRPMMNTPEVEDPSTMPPGMGQQMNTPPQTLPMPGMMPQATPQPGQPQPQMTAPRPGFLPAPAPIKPPGGGGDL
jgi:hypothetical protein